jgi:hypothetical protein
MGVSVASHWDWITTSAREMDAIYGINTQFNPVPEPSAAVLVWMAACCLAAVWTRRRILGGMRSGGSGGGSETQS